MKLSLAAGLAVYVSLVNAFKGKMTHYTVRTHLIYPDYPPPQNHYLLHPRRDTASPTDSY